MRSADLVDRESSEDFDLPSRLSPENEQRVKYLIENDVWELPDEERPVCHQDGKGAHSVWSNADPVVAMG